MKTNLFFSLGLASLSLGSAIQLEKRQSLAMIANFVPGIKPTVIDAPPLLRPAAKRKLLRFGPFTLPPNKGNTAAPKPGSMDHGQHVNPSAKPKPPPTLAQLLTASKPMDPNGVNVLKRIIGGFCKNCTVIAGKTTIVFENGTRADITKGVYLHHALAIDASKPFPNYLPGCGKDTIAGKGGRAFSAFLGGAVDEFKQFYTTEDGVFNSGYYVKDNTFILQAEIVNYVEKAQKVMIEIDYEYQDGLVGFDAAQAQLPATKCDNALSSFSPKKGEIGEVTSEKFPVTRDGSLLAMRGHMHDGGKNVQMFLNGKLACSSNAEYGGNGGNLIVDGKEWQTITKMTECAGPIQVKKGDILTVSAAYDTVAHPARESHGDEQENMGLITFVFVPA